MMSISGIIVFMAFEIFPCAEDELTVAGDVEERVDEGQRVGTMVRSQSNRMTVARAPRNQNSRELRSMHV